VSLPRLIATDLDGTLLDPRGRMSQRSVDALRAADDAGIVVAFASGRPPFVAADQVQQVGAAVRYGVMANGSIICSFPDATVLRAFDFPAAAAMETIRTLRATDSQFGFALATDRGFTAEAGFAERMPVHRPEKPADDALVGHEGAAGAFKLLVFHHRYSALDLLELLPPLVGPHLSVGHMGAEAVEVGPVGADKGNGLRWLCTHLDIDLAGVVVFGDEVNDLAMFAAAGTSVAVANAHPTVLDACDVVTSSNADDGVAAFIEELLATG
jgi:hypothetical protein